MLTSQSSAWYPRLSVEERGIQGMSALAIKTEVEQVVKKVSRPKARKWAGSPKGNNQMSEEIQEVDAQEEQEAQSAGAQPQAGEKRESQKTVFDLKTFDNVLLKKGYELPRMPTSTTDALAMVGNDTQALLSTFWNGLCKKVMDDTYNSAVNDGTWFLTDKDKNITSEAYTGQSADKDKKAMIDAAVLTLAKLNGYDKDMSAEAKEAKKEAARKFLRENPAMLGGLQS